MKWAWQRTDVDKWDYGLRIRLDMVVSRCSCFSWLLIAAMKSSERMANITSLFAVTRSGHSHITANVKATSTAFDTDGDVCVDVSIGSFLLRGVAGFTFELLQYLTTFSGWIVRQ
jgi:hypothetical protein